MRYFRFSILLLPFFIVACNQEPAGKKPVVASPFEQQAKTPLEQQINKVTNTVIIEPLRALRDDSYFYREKQYLTTAFDNSTQKDIFFSCDEFKKSLLQLLQTDYSEDFVPGSWQRGEIEKLSQDLSKEQCANIYTLRADFLAELQSVLNHSETKDSFMENAKPIVKKYAQDILDSNEYYTNLFNETLAPYKKIRQIFYPLEKAGYGTYFWEQNAFKDLKQIITPGLQGKNTDEDKINKLLNKAQEDEKLLFVFLKKYESLTQTNGECINKFFPGLKEKWYDFMYQIEQLPTEKRQAYADKRFNQANDGLKTKCADLLKKSKKKNTAQTQQVQGQFQEETYQEQPQIETYQGNQEEEEIYDF
ncbi:MAG: hypothetical protein J5594_04330 [Elusimicrobiaceae bacterium]|nr:hypothetical protein [Elusimicrobiaceae bacterium]